MLRRRFLSLAASTGAVALVRGAATRADRERFIQTVRGRIAVDHLGLTLPHEHVLVDFVGADAVSPARYDADEVFAAVLPHLKQAHAFGVRSLFECTPAFLARDPELLVRLSAASGIHLVTNTGLYGARQNKFLPRYAFDESAAQLAQRWIREARDGIDDTGVRPGFIKSGIDPDPKLSPAHRKLVESCARTHAETGLAIAIHTGRGPGAEVIDTLVAHGVAPSAYVWVHAQHAPDDALFAAADRGAWLSFDGINRQSLARHLHLCRELRARGHLERVLLSHDAGWFDPAKPGGGTFRPYDLLFTAFLPSLRENGFSDAEIERLTIANPAEAFAVGVRSHG